MDSFVTSFRLSRFAYPMHEANYWDKTVDVDWWLCRHYGRFLISVTVLQEIHAYLQLLLLGL